MAIPMMGTSKRTRKPRLLVVSCCLTLLMVVLCGLQLFLMRHVHSAERAVASTTEAGVLPTSSISSGRITSPSSTTITDKSNSDRRRLLPPPPKTQATSKNVKKPPPPTYSASDFENCTLLRPDDMIYQYGPWDMAPIVLERYQLLLFTIPKVGCTLLKQFCRRAMGYLDWLDDVHPLPHAPKRNGLAYLYDYPPSMADHMLTSPEWTRAIFVREPLERLLSAYLDKGVQNQYMQFHCCRGLHVDGSGNDDDNESVDDSASDSTAAKNTNTTIHKRLYELLQCGHRQAHQGPMASELDSKRKEQTPLLQFADFLFLIQHHPSQECRHDPHWKPQAQRLDLKYWTTLGIMNYIGHMETMAIDTQRLLERVGAWDEHGSHGWPPNEGAMFAGPVTVHHATDSSSKLAEYYRVNTTLAMAHELVQADYDLIPGFAKPNLAAMTVTVT